MNQTVATFVTAVKLVDIDPRLIEFERAVARNVIEPHLIEFAAYAGGRDELIDLLAHVHAIAGHCHEHGDDFAYDLVWPAWQRITAEEPALTLEWHWAFRSKAGI